ncbi:MAG: response regulator [Verrucomicrobiaceae bacterium]
MQTSAVQSSEKKLLIVDDEELLRTVFSLALRSDRVTTCEAGDGHEALNMLRNQDYDLVLLDLRMPGPSGLDVLKRMRQLGDFTPVIIVSAFIPGSAVIRAISQGVTTFAGKPMTLTYLRRMVENQLSRSQHGEMERAKRCAEQMDFSGALAELPDGRDAEIWRKIFEGLAEGKSPRELSHLERKAESLVTLQPAL